MVSSSLRRSSSSGKVMMSIAREDSERSTMREKMRRCESSEDRKSTRLNSSHSQISYAVFCLKKKKKTNDQLTTRQSSAATSLHRTYLTFLHNSTFMSLFPLASTSQLPHIVPTYYILYTPST